MKRLAILIFSALLSIVGLAQEVFFFTEGTDESYYDQGIVDKAGLGGSAFEFTFPTGAPQYNDKVPCSTTSRRGATSLKFNYLSAPDGNWKVTVYRSGWSTADLSQHDSLAFFIYSEEFLPASALPLIGLRGINKNNDGDVESALYSLAGHNSGIPPGEWTRVGIPLSIWRDDAANDALDFSKIKGVVFNQSESDGSSRLLLIDDLFAFTWLDELPEVENLTADGYDSHTELRWTSPANDLNHRIYVSYDGGQNYMSEGETTNDYFLDFVPEEARNSTIHYRVVTTVSEKESAPQETSADIHVFSDEQLLDMVQRYAFRYFWEGAHQASGVALERSNGDGTTVVSGATGMGLMALIVAHEREYESREEVKERVLQILDFLTTCERHHGAWSHWYNGDTRQTKAFTPDDDGGDIVETSYVAQALIALRNYFSGTDASSVQIREKATILWEEIEWDWYRNGENVMCWHWSPTIGFQKGMKVRGWNEALVTYLMAASSPVHGIEKTVYEQGWARDGGIVNPRTFYNYDISLSPDWGGPLFWLHYSHLGINPHGLEDQYAKYWDEHVNTVKIHYAYAVDNPMNHEGYGPDGWGLTASDDPDGYTAHEPWNNDNGTISPTAALASMPYLPMESMRFLKYLYRQRGQELFGIYGPYDAFNDSRNWIQEDYIGIDQGPIVVMIENHRTGLLWKNVMKDSEVQAGLEKLGFKYQDNSVFEGVPEAFRLEVSPNPVSQRAFVALPQVNPYFPVTIRLFNTSGQLVRSEERLITSTGLFINCSGLSDGLWLLEIRNGNKRYVAKLMVEK